MMLDEQIVKVAECLETVVSQVDAIKAETETRNKAMLAVTADITNVMHLLEADENISDEKAAEYAKTLVERRRRRRELKAYIEIADPLILFWNEHGETMEKLRVAVVAMQKQKEKAESPIFNPRVAEGSTQVGSTQVGSTQVGSTIKPPRPILCTTAGGLTIAFDSIAQAARAFLYSSQEIVSCAKGYIDNIDGDRFTFITENLPPNVKNYSQVRNGLISELTLRAQRKKLEQHKQELIAAQQGRKTQVEKFEARLAKTEEKQNKPEPEATPVKSKGWRAARPVRGTADDGTTVEYPSVKAAGLAHGCDVTAVGKAIREGWRCKGYRWEYI